MKSWQYMTLKFTLNVGAVVKQFEQEIVSNNVFINEWRKQGWEVASIISKPSHKGDRDMVVSLKREVHSP